MDPQTDPHPEPEHPIQEDQQGGQCLTCSPLPQSTSTSEPGSWHNLALISEGGRRQGTYSMVLTGLERAAEYEVRRRSGKLYKHSSSAETEGHEQTGMEPTLIAIHILHFR